MNNVIACHSCDHYEVCRFKETYERVSNAVFSMHVNEYNPDGGIKSIPLSNFECIGDIVVNCKFYKRTNIRR